MKIPPDHAYNLTAWQPRCNLSQCARRDSESAESPLPSAVVHARTIWGYWKASTSVGKSETAGPTWRIWRPGDAPFKPPTSLIKAGNNDCRNGTFAGGLSGMNLSYPGEPVVTAPMCLFRQKNLISDTIHSTGRWHDCASLTDAWKKLNSPAKN